MSNKVYCRNCKYYWTNEWSKYRLGKPFVRYCLYPKDKTICKNFEGATVINTEKTRNPEKINKDNNCPNYKRKWYKFWIRA